MRFLSLLLFLCCLPTMAQQAFTLKGTIVDKASGSPIPYANIYSNGIYIALTDNEGKFQCPLNLEKDSVLNIQAMKYYNLDYPIVPTSDSIVFEMRPDSFGLGKEFKFEGTPDTTFFENGNVESLIYLYDARKTFYESGNIYALVNIGASKMYYENGNLMEISIQFSAHAILYTYWYENGQMAANGYEVYDMKSASWTYSEGWREWKKNGKLK